MRYALNKIYYFMSDIVILISIQPDCHRRKAKADCATNAGRGNVDTTLKFRRYRISSIRFSFPISQFQICKLFENLKIQINVRLERLSNKTIPIAMKFSDFFFFKILIS